MDLHQQVQLHGEHTQSTYSPTSLVSQQDQAQPSLYLSRDSPRPSEHLRSNRHQ